MNALVLFAGAGGADLGLHQAGYRIHASVEGNATACATLSAAGFPAVHAWIGTPPVAPSPEAGKSGKRNRFPPMFVWDGTPIDLLWLSPACQPYSSAGHQLGAEDERDGWPTSLQLIEQIRPSCLAVENVVGAPVDQWSDQIAHLYTYRKVWRVDAANFGLPSQRERVFLLASNRPFSLPVQTHQGPKTPSLLSLIRSAEGMQNWNSFGEALGLRPDAPEPEKRPFEIVAKLSLGGRGGNAFRQPHMPSPTLCAINSTTIRHDDGSTRRMSTREAAILCGFPEGYPFQGGEGAIHRQIGNCVAPIMSEVIGRMFARQEAGKSESG